MKEFMKCPSCKTENLVPVKSDVWIWIVNTFFAWSIKLSVPKEYRPSKMTKITNTCRCKNCGSRVWESTIIDN